MRFSGVVSVRDHQDLVGFLAGRRRLWWRRQASSLLLVCAGFFVAFAGLSFIMVLAEVFRGDKLQDLLSQPYVAGLILLGVLTLPLAVVLLRDHGRLWSRLRSQPKDAEMVRDVLREGVNIGEMAFDADDRGLVIAASLVRSTYAWTAFRQLAESERNLFLLVDAGAAVILPKAALGGEAGLQAFKALAGPRIGGAR